MKRIFRFLIALAALLALTFSLGFFFGRNTLPDPVRVSVQRTGTQKAEPAPEDRPDAAQTNGPEASDDVAEQNEPETPDKSAASDEPVSAQAPVNLNTATKEELMRLPGVGEVLAERIIAYRQQVGRFVSAEQIMDVSGIGEQKFASLAEFICVEE